MRMNNLNKKIEDVEALAHSKTDPAALDETKKDVKEILKKVTDLQVELARWQGRAEAREKN
jgi:hypothetical protein